MIVDKNLIIKNFKDNIGEMNLIQLILHYPNVNFTLEKGALPSNLLESIVIRKLHRAYVDKDGSINLKKCEYAVPFVDKYELITRRDAELELDVLKEMEIASLENLMAYDIRILLRSELSVLHPEIRNLILVETTKTEIVKGDRETYYFDVRDCDYYLRGIYDCPLSKKPKLEASKLRPEKVKGLRNALKTAMNSVYGSTSDFDGEGGYVYAEPGIYDSGSGFDGDVVYYE